MAFVGEQTITVIPRTAAVSTDGKWVATEGAPVTVQATVNPIPGEDLQYLEGVKHQAHHRRVITEYELNAASQDGTNPGDIVIYDGDYYEVKEAQRYQMVIPHVAARITRIAREAQP